MATSAGIWSGAAQNAAQPDKYVSDNSATGNTNSATISANDFLTLLVTEMQNQDPTANTDPNEYINQLVNVNSLEQLISINQTLQTATTSSGATTSPKPSTSDSTSSQLAAEHHTGIAALPNPSGLHLNSEATRGNLAIPKSNPAAARVAQGLMEP